MRKLSFLPALAALTCSFMTAAAPTSPTAADLVAERVARLTKLLSLTTGQANTATSLFTTEETAVATIRTSLATARTALTTAVEANSTSGIAAAANQIGTLTAGEIQAEGAAEAGFYAVLTTDQQTKYKELLAAGLDSPGRDDHGGHPHR
jgi:hypothetical protein